MSEQPSPGRRLSPGLVVMLVVLAAVAATMGYLVARQVIAGRDSSGNGALPGSNGTEPAVSATTPGPEPTIDPATSTQPPGPDQSQPDDANSCPNPTRDAVTAAGLNAELTLLIYIEFEVRRGPARVWVCRNADDVLIYQAHERWGPFDRGFNGQNTLLLATGIKGEVAEVADGFRASNPDNSGTTEYTVTREALTVKLPSGSTTRYEVTKVLPPG